MKKYLLGFLFLVLLTSCTIKIEVNNPDQFCKNLEEKPNNFLIEIEGEGDCSQASREIKETCGIETTCEEVDYNYCSCHKVNGRLK